MNIEKQRLAEANANQKSWRRFGPYLSERQWGTVREDYSPHGNAWEYLPAVLSHFSNARGIAGVLLVKFGLGRIFTDAPVRYVVTVPGKADVATAFVAEMAIACGMMLMVQFMTNTAVELYRALRKGTRVACAKWNHAMRHRCIFCGHPGIQRQKLPT